MYTNYNAIKIKGNESNDTIADIMSGITEHFSMNGYTFDTNMKDVIFVYDEEIDYALTVLKDHGIKYEML